MFPGGGVAEGCCEQRRFLSAAFLLPSDRTADLAIVGELPG